jgi:DNA-binding MurR/RpiR family transcriptional regulator
MLSGEASAGVARHFCSQLRQLRDGVSELGGNEVAVRRDLALLPDEATAIVIDLRRYERWVLEAHAAIHSRGIWSAGLTDSMLSPIAARADETFLVGAASAGPFDSHVGTLALLNLFTANVASTLRGSAAERLAMIESAWGERSALTDSD